MNFRASKSNCACNRESSLELWSDLVKEVGDLALTSVVFATSLSPCSGPQAWKQS